MSTNNSSRRNKRSTQKIGLFSSLFVTFAGSDKSILRQCSQSEITKHASIGITIFATALLACLSGGYALYTVFRNTNLNTIDTEALWYAIPFGLIWGFLVIFNLDRFIISTFRKGGGFWREFGMALPRIILAIIIAIVISKPIEIKIFESRLSEQIQLNKQKAEKTNLEHYQATNQISTKENKVSDLDSKISNLYTEREYDPQNVKDMIEIELKKANDELTNIRSINNEKIAKNETERGKIYNNSANWVILRDSLENETGKELSKWAKDRRYALWQENQILQKEIRNKEETVNSITKNIDTARKEYKALKDKEIEDKNTEKKNAQTELDTAKSTAKQQTAEADSTSSKAFSNNFITQLEALGDLTDYRQYEVGSPERAKAKTMNLASWAIMLLLLVVELAPVLTKLITKRGNYDVLLDEEEDKVNFIARHENIANKFLVKELSIAQREVLSKAIVKWKEQEMDDEELANHYINRNTENEQ